MFFDLQLHFSVRCSEFLKKMAAQFDNCAAWVDITLFAGETACCDYVCRPNWAAWNQSHPHPLLHRLQQLQLLLLLLLLLLLQLQPQRRLQHEFVTKSGNTIPITPNASKGLQHIDMNPPNNSRGMSTHHSMSADGKCARSDFLWKAQGERLRNGCGQRASVL